MGKFISDEEMSELEKQQPVATSTSKKFISDEEMQKLEQPQEVALTPITEQITAPATGYMAGRATQEAISKTGEIAGRGLEKIAELGGTSPEQLRTIKQNFPEFKATDPVEEMNKLLATARGTNLEVNRMYAEAEKLLADKKITPDEYRNIVQSALLEKDKYGQRTFAKPISQSEIQKANINVINDLKQQSILDQQKKLDEFAKLKADEAVKKANFEYKITNATNQELPKNIQNEIKNNVINEIKTNPQEAGFKELGSEILKGDYDYKLKKQIENLQTPLAKEFPFLEGTSIVPAEEKAFQKILGMPSKADIPGNRLQEMLREFRDVGFTEGGQLSDKPAASMSREVRKEIAKMSPEAGKLMEAENIELNKLEGLEKAGYIKREGSGIKTTIEMTDTQRNKIVKDLATSYDKASPTDVVENLQVLADYLPPDELKKLKLAAMKLAEKRGGGVDYINANKINAILQSITKRSVSRAVATIPEAFSTAFPKTTAIAKAVGKTAFKGLPILGAGIGGVAAQAAEEAASPETSGALPTMPEYWLEKGIKDPEEQIRRARLSSFKAGLPQQGRLDEIPGAYDKPEVKAYKEKVLEVEKLGALAPSYVEAPMKKVLKSDDPAEIVSVAQALQTNTDKASQEYARVLNQIVDAPASQKEAVLFGLNQQPAFRELVRKIKEQK